MTFSTRLRVAGSTGGAIPASILMVICRVALVLAGAAPVVETLFRKKKKNTWPAKIKE